MNEQLIKVMKNVILEGKLSIASSMNKYFCIESFSNEVEKSKSHAVEALAKNIASEDLEKILIGIDLLEKYEDAGVDFELFRDHKRENKD